MITGKDRISDSVAISSNKYAKVPNGNNVNGVRKVSKYLGVNSLLRTQDIYKTITIM